MTSSVICICEDRRSEQVAVKLLILSLARHCPDLQIVLTYPPADGDFIKWAATLARVDLRVEPVPGTYGWNVKPQAALALLEEGAGEVWWLDSDLIVTRDFTARLGGMPDETIVACEEALYGGGGHLDEGERARAWGFQVARILPSTLNTGVVRVTRAHVPLLERWRQLLESDEYRRSQRLPWNQRPVHMIGDQDVLTALLSSAEFAAVPLLRLVRGADIIQYFGPPGYTTRERLASLTSGVAPFVHEQGGGKPWHLADARTSAGPRAVIDRLYSELSPYRFFAKEYRDELEDELLESNWIDGTSRAGRMLELLGLGNAALTGFPLALAYSIWSPIKRARDSARRRVARTPWPGLGGRGDA